jgi:hypothetical protein
VNPDCRSGLQSPGHTVTVNVFITVTVTNFRRRNPTLLSHPAGERKRDKWSAISLQVGLSFTDCQAGAKQICKQVAIENFGQAGIVDFITLLKKSNHPR